MSKEDLTRMQLRFEDETAILLWTNGTNVIDHKFIEEMNKALDLVLENDDIKIFASVSEGKFYSNGLDLQSILNSGLEKLEMFMDSFNALCARLITFPMPTVAAINGHGFAGGFLLALSHDYRVMNSEKGWLCMNEVFMPQRFPPFLLELLKQKLPSGVTQTEVISLGVRFTGPEAHQAGIVQAAVPNQQLLTTAIQLARKTLKYGDLGRLALNGMKYDQYRSLLDMLGTCDNGLTGLDEYFEPPKSKL